MHRSRLLERTRLNISCAGLLLGICKVVAAQTGPDLAENNSSLAGTATTDTHPAAKAPCNTEGQKAKLHIYLLLGQSNMYGRGALEPQDRTPHPRVLLFTSSNQWISAVEPLHGHGPRAGIGPGLAFGKALVASNTNAAIGLVPCALGASELRRWERGGDLYSNALARATAAMRDGTLAGILWHQGEQDSMTETNSNTYHHRLAKMIGDIRTDLAKPELPFVVGQIGEFLYNRRVQQTPFARLVNNALARIPAQVPHTACVPSTGLTHVGDEVHFDGRSQRELGRRYAEEMLRLQAAKSF